MMKLLLLACLAVANATDLATLIAQGQVESVAGRVPSNEQRLPGDAVCPTPLQCPLGYTGQYCDILMCPTRGTVAVSNYNAIDIRTYAVCDATVYFPVDSHVKELYVFVDTTVPGSNPQLSLVDPYGNAVMPVKVIVNDTATLEVQYAITPGYGQYAATFRAGNACVFEVHATTDLTVSVGFTMSRTADNPTPTLPQFSYSYMVSHVNKLPVPGRARLVEIYENGQLLHSYTLSSRYNCGYDQYAGPVICSSANNYWYKIIGLDENGAVFMRTDPIRCVGGGGGNTTTPAMTTTASTPTTSSGPPNPCQNGGFPAGPNSCFCPPQYTGQFCQTAICMNGGTPQDSMCLCPTGFTGTFCDVAVCTSMNPMQPMGPNGRSLVFVVQITSTMRDDVNALKTYITAVVDMFVEHHPQFLTQFGLVVFNDKYDVIAYNGGDVNAFLTAMHNFFMMTGAGACKKPVMTGVQTAVKMSRPGGHVYVLTDSPPNDANAAVLTDIFGNIERRLLTVNFIVTKQMDPTCSLQPADYRVYRDTADFSGGDSLTLDSKRAVAQALQVIPTAYMSARTYEQHFNDCTTVQQVYVPVDSHTASIVVTVKGNIPVVAFFEPQGTRYAYGNDLLYDVNVVVSQAITPCPDTWASHGYACYKGFPDGDTWTNAQANCAALGGHMVNVLNGEKQAYLNQELKGLDMWIGLNDRVRERQFMWDGPIPLPLDNYYTNWAPGEPAIVQDRDCVAIIHPLVNGTIGDARWFTRYCSEIRAYACQRHAFDFNNNRLVAGFWTLAVQTRDSGKPNGMECSVRVQAQTDIQVMAGFASTPNSDFPQPVPNSKTPFYVVANLGANLGATHADFLDVFASNMSTNLARTAMSARQNCFYPFVTTDVMPNCPAVTFGMAFFGHDENSYAFSRIRNAYCASSAAELVHQLGYVDE